jgi:hypothetical protein
VTSCSPFLLIADQWARQLLKELFIHQQPLCLSVLEISSRFARFPENEKVKFISKDQLSGKTNLENSLL